jgi:serine/threonine protein kinase
LSKTQAACDREETISGTYEYLAPEVLNRQPQSPASDWWAYGLVVFEMLCGFHPFYSENRNEVCERILSMPLDFPFDISSAAIDVLARCLERDTHQRITGREIQQHAFFAPLNWDQIFNKSIPVPFTPELDDDMDVKFFDNEFTNQPPILTPTSRRSVALPFSASFSGFSFVESNLDK